MWSDHENDRVAYADDTTLTAVAPFPKMSGAVQIPITDIMIKFVLSAHYGV